MSNQPAEAQRSWWKLILLGLLAFAFGIAAIVFPVDIIFRRILDVVFHEAKPLSGSMTAVAALLALVAVVAIDGLIHLFGSGPVTKRGSRLRGVVGLAVAIVAVFWPGITGYVAVNLIGAWAVLVGVLELIFTRDSAGNTKDRALLIISAIASIVIGVGMMVWVFAGAVLVSAVVGIAAAARGVSLVLSGISQRRSQLRGEGKPALRPAA